LIARERGPTPQTSNAWMVRKRLHRVLHPPASDEFATVFTRRSG
jgi:hypothetical protein